MAVDFGRPRDPRIDAAVLEATVELLAETGYPGLLVAEIAKRAGTSKPAIYRRWPSKAHLVHEAVFPIGAATAIPDTGSPREDLREMVRRTIAVLTTPAARAALPGLIGEMAADPTLHSALLERFAGLIGGGLAQWLKRSAARSEVRPEATALALHHVASGAACRALEDLFAVGRIPHRLNRSFHLHAANVGDYLPDFFFRHADTLLCSAVLWHSRTRNTFIDRPKKISIGISVFFLRARQIGAASAAASAKPVAKRAVRAKFKFP